MTGACSPLSPSGQLVGIRIEPATLMFFDPGTRVLLRTRPNPLTPAQVARVRGARPAGPPPRPPFEPVQVQRRASATGVIVVCGQKIALGRAHAGQTLTVAVSATTLAIELDDAETRVVRRTTTTPARNIKAGRGRPPAGSVRPGPGTALACKGHLTSLAGSRYLDIMRNRVREQRTQREMSQAELAAALGVSRQTVISIEGGRYLPSLPLAFAIARFFGLTVDKMFDPDEEEAGT